jgi:hypothetical protein
MQEMISGLESTVADLEGNLTSLQAVGIEASEGIYI